MNSKEVRYKELMRVMRTRKGSFIDGGVHFYFHVFTAPISNLINIPYINDIPPIQLRYHKRDKKEINESLEKYKDRSKHMNAFIGLNKTFCETIKKIYEIDVPYGYFVSFPPWFESPHIKRNEIVYLDHSATAPYGFREHLEFLDKIAKTSNIRVLFVSKKFPKDAEDIAHKNKFKVDIIPYGKYDFGSKYGILMNTNNFNQAYFAIPRKLLIYLMCNMNVLVDDSWIESINFMKENGVNPYIYKDETNFINLDKHNFGIINPRSFCLEERIKFLDNELIRLSNIARKKT